jgi:hypothetical protein
MATCQAESAVLPPVLHKSVSFIWCPCFLEGCKACINLELPSYFLHSRALFIEYTFKVIVFLDYDYIITSCSTKLYEGDQCSSLEDETSLMGPTSVS